MIKKKKIRTKLLISIDHVYRVKKKNIINNLVQVSSKTEMSLPLNEML